MITIPETLPIEIKDKYDIVNDTFIRKDKGEVAEEREVEIGDVHSDDFQPQVKLKQWDNETNFSVRLIDDEPTAPTIKTEGNKIKFIKKDRECHFYDVEKGFEFEVLLKKKPKTNKVQMSIESKGLKFYPQKYLKDLLPEGSVAKSRMKDVVSKESFSTIVDIGGGTGEFIKQFNGTCLDNSEEAYSLRVTDNYIKADIKNGVSEINNDDYDLAIGIGFLKYLKDEDIEKALKEIERISKKGVFFVGRGFRDFPDNSPIANEHDRNWWLDKFNTYIPNYEVEIYDIALIDRPKNVEGSYAVYHESKQNDYSKIGGKNYRAGKAFQMYFPSLIDANGWKVRAEDFKIIINPDGHTGLLTVTAPQNFIDNAVYPVRHAAGLKFGYETAGTAGSTVIDHTMVGSKFSGAAGTADSLHASLDEGDLAVNGKGCIYKHSDSAKIADGETPEVSLNNNGQTWRTFTYSTNPTLTAQDYVLIVSSVGHMYIDIIIYYDDGATDQGHYEGITYPTFPATANFSHNNNKYSIYCTYTAGGATEKNVTDVGSGADAVSVLCQTPVTDSGAGADTATVLASMNLTDTGSGADTISIIQLKSLLETGSGADLISLINKLSVTDSGTGSEIISLLGKIAVTDTGVGSEALSVLSQLSLTDTGAGSEAISVLVRIALTDTGAGSEALDILYKNAITDTGTGSEIITLLAQIVLQETGTGADAVSKQDMGDSKQVLDNGTGTEALSVLAQIAITDSGTGAEAITALVGLSVLDSGIGSEVIAVLSQILQTDSGSGAEALEILRKIAVSDSGTASEAITVLVQLAISETGSGADEITVSGESKFIQDTGLGSEALNILVGMSIADSGVGSEILDILNQIALTDTASGADAITVIGQVALSDSGAGSEALETLTKIAVSDSGAGAEALEVLVQVAMTDAGSGIEALNILNQLAVADNGSGADEVSATEMFDKQITDSGAGADTVAFAKQILLQDSGTGADSVMKQKITAAIATILSVLDKNANIKFTGQTKQPIIKYTNQVKAKIKKIINN